MMVIYQVKIDCTATSSSLSRQILVTLVQRHKPQYRLQCLVWRVSADCNLVLNSNIFKFPTCCKISDNRDTTAVTKQKQPEVRMRQERMVLSGLREGVADGTFWLLCWKEFFWFICI